MNVQNKEQVIVGTILSCNTVIQQLQQKKAVKPLMECNIYHYNMLNLYSEIIGMSLHNLNESKIFENDNGIKLGTRQNYYAYFQKVDNFLSGYEIKTQQSLNESLVSLSDIQLEEVGNISSFKLDLKRCINELENINDFQKNYDKQIQSIKLFAKLPMFVYGFDVVNSLPLQQELQVNFGKNISDIISIIFDKSSKILFFVFNHDLIYYDIKNDVFQFVLEQWKLKITNINYKDLIISNISANIVEIHFNNSYLPNEMKTFSDNLFSDNLRTKAINEISKRSLIKR